MRRSYRIRGKRFSIGCRTATAHITHFDEEVVVGRRHDEVIGVYEVWRGRESKGEALTRAQEVMKVRGGEGGA